jgi:2-keto-myo-inositol isomerase
MIDQNRFALNRSVYPRLDLAGFFELASRVGIQKVELRNDLSTGIIDTHSAEEVRSLEQKFNIRTITINRLPEFNAASPPPQLFAELKALLNLAVAISCDAIILVPTRSNSDTRSREQVFQDTVKALKNFRPFFEQSGVFGYIETLGFSDCSLRSLVDAMMAIRESGGTHYKVTYDTFHHYLGPDTPASIQQAFDVSYLGLVHVSGVTHDAPPGQLTDSHRVMVDAGDKLGNIRQLALLEKLGYRGNISFEPFAREIQELDLHRVEEVIRESLAFIQNMTGRTVSELSSATS